ncbi:MAG TPA: hypothetical protein VKJ00_03440 [Thermoanaerobaculia bacterium]|nr:hypothetical protein [Thermoanaerobaculia bacterium]
MGRINVARWLLGGIVAGILVNISETVLNTVVLKSPWEAVMKSLGKPSVMTSSSMIVWICWGFAYGLLCVWLYAAIRPRFGAGPSTAVKAGLVAWMLSGLLSSVGMGNLGLMPSSLLVTTAAWTLVESIVVTLVGAAIYREGPAA